MILTDDEKQLLHKAFDVAIKSSQDSLAAASALIPLFQKIVDTPEA